MFSFAFAVTLLDNKASETILTKKIVYDINTNS
jgi:hypothetical protein